MPTFRQDEKLGTKVPLIKTADFNDKSVTTEKLAEGSVTNSKLAPESVTQDKFDKELLQIFKAAAGLPENLIETIQNVDSTLVDHQRQISSNDDDISDLQTKTKQIKDTVDGIAVSGGASVGSAVTFDNTQSGLYALNIQNAIDELVNNLGHYETDEEWLRVYTDAENKFLWGIRVDGSIDWAVGIPRPIQKKIEELIATDTAIQESITQLRTELTESLNKKIQSLKDNEIKNLQDTKVDKEEGKSLIEDEVKECFRIIENEEFIHAVIDSDGRLLFGIYRDSGKPYFPNHEMYSVITNEEWLYVIIDAENKVLGGFRSDDGHMIVGGIDISTFIANAIIDISDIKERTAHLSTIVNDEYLSVETDAEGKVIGYIASDGSHYLYKVKSETIPTEFYHIEDPEGRTEITTDAENKILGYRDSEGTRHEHKISAKHINLSDEAAKEVNDAFKSAGIKMENPSDFSKDSHIELPIPRVAAQVRIYAPKLPTTKQDDIEAEIEYNDKDGNYFRKPVILNAQGSSSMGYYVKNMAIDIADESEIKFGDFPTQDSFHLKKYYIDAFRGQCIVGYWLMEQVYKSRPLGKQYPYEYNYSNDSVTDSLGDVKKDFTTGAKCHPDGFPIIITWVNSETMEETWMGVYAWNLKKSKEIYNCDKKKAENIILDGEIGHDTLFNGTVNWTKFEIRNPKSLIDIDGNKYNGDNPKELSDTDGSSKKVKDYITRLSGVVAALKESNTKETFEKYFLVNPFIDYFLASQILYNFDGFYKNWIWVTYNGLQWTPTAYDLDSIFGQHWNGTNVVVDSDKNALLYDDRLFNLTTLYADDIKSRYKELRNSGVFTVNNILGLLNRWLNSIGYDNLVRDLELYNETPSYRKNFLNEGWEFVLAFTTTVQQYDSTKEYQKDAVVSYQQYVFKAKRTIQGIPPLSAIYQKDPKIFGFYNSPKRVENWLNNKINSLDKMFNL